MRAALDSLYRFALWLSALCLAGIVLIVGLQLLGRIVDGALNLMGVPVYGFVILSMAEIAGYLLAAASFLALAGTLKAGAHIRVTMFLGGLSDGARRWAELWTLGFAAVFSGYMTWHIAVFAYFSWAYDEVSPGLIAVPLMYPQAAMAFGALLLTLAFADEFMNVLRGGRPTFQAAEDAITAGKEG